MYFKKLKLWSHCFSRERYFPQVLIEQSRLSEADNNGCAVGGEMGGVEGGRGWKRVEPPPRWFAVCLLQSWREVSGIVDLARCKWGGVSEVGGPIQWSVHTQQNIWSHKKENQVETFGQNSDARIHAGSNIQQPSDWGQIYRVATVNRTR